MKAMSVLTGVLSIPLIRQAVPVFEAASPYIGRRAQDMLRFAIAKVQFGAGDYGAARRLSDSVGEGPERAEADLMVDWIDYKFGHVGGGWPRYPVARFDPPQLARVAPGTDPVRVRNFNLPVELVDELGLRSWRPGECPDGPVLVWFNFHDSLGGEVLASKVVAAFQAQAGVNLMLAVDERHVTAIRQNFPDTPVIAKSSDLRPLAGKVWGYFLARDALTEVVRCEDDFVKVAGRTFLAPVAAPPLQPRIRPLLAVAWKTTNRRQRRFRNLPIGEFASLLSGIDADFVSAQHSTTRREREFLTRRLDGRIRFDVIDTSGDLASLATALSACDGVVTIDNSVLHVAGGFGVPTLALLAVPSYWAWPVRGPDSRWYPSVRLVHQAVPGQWAAALSEATAILQDWRGGSFT
jgi:hypothetical protein